MANTTAKCRKETHDSSLSYTVYETETINTCVCVCVCLDMHKCVCVREKKRKSFLIVVKCRRVMVSRQQHAFSCSKLTLTQKRSMQWVHNISQMALLKTFKIGWSINQMVLPKKVKVLFGYDLFIFLAYWVPQKGGWLPNIMQIFFFL